MIVPLIDSVTGVPTYVNPTFVMTLRPDPVDPEHQSVVKLQDGEFIRVRGDHEKVAKELGRA